jgi:hypothetical protein
MKHIALALALPLSSCTFVVNEETRPDGSYHKTAYVQGPGGKSQMARTPEGGLAIGSDNHETASKIVAGFVTYGVTDILGGVAKAKYAKDAEVATTATRASADVQKTTVKEIGSTARNAAANPELTGANVQAIEAAGRAVRP